MFKIRFKIVSSLVLAFAITNAEIAVSETLSESLKIPFRGVPGTIEQLPQTVATTIEFDPQGFEARPEITVSRPNSVESTNFELDSCTPICEDMLAGDHVEVRRTNDNDVQLTLTYLSSFSEGNCSVHIGEDKELIISLTDFDFAGGSVRYRIGSHMAAPGSCESASVRVSTDQPFFPPESPWEKVGRLALNVMLVLDKSGSMNLNMPGSNDPESRWDRLKSSVNLFAAAWETFGAPPAAGLTSSKGHPDDKLGIVFFNSLAQAVELIGSEIFSKRGDDTNPWTDPQSNVVQEALDNVTVGGWTSIGAGIEEAKNKLNVEPLVRGGSAVVLFTDGEQNRRPCIIHEPESLSPVGSDCSVANALSVDDWDGEFLWVRDGQSEDRRLAYVEPPGPIFTVALGEAAVGSSVSLLDKISQETVASARVAFDGLGMDSALALSLVDNLQGGTVSLMGRTDNTIPTSTQSTAPSSLIVDKSITRIVFMLSWNGRDYRDVALNIQNPDGTAIAPDLQSSGTNFLVQGFNVSAADAGDWIAQVSRYSNLNREFEYQLSAYAVESQFSSSVSENSKFRTGQPINVSAGVGWGNGMLEGLPAGAVKAFIEKPSENFGNIMFENESPKDIKSGEDSSAFSNKFNYLAKDRKLIRRIEPSAESKSIALEDVGGGYYEGTFEGKGVDVGGNYRIRVEFDWDDPRTGAIKRVKYIERPVAVAPTAKASKLTGIVDDKKNILTLLLTPRDNFGNYLGPGFASQIRVMVGKKQINPSVIDPDLKGIYAIRDPHLAIENDPQVHILFGDSVLARGTLSDLIDYKGGSGVRGECKWYSFRCGIKWIGDKFR